MHEFGDADSMVDDHVPALQAIHDSREEAATTGDQVPRSHG